MARDACLSAAIQALMPGFLGLFNDISTPDRDGAPPYVSEGAFLRWMGVSFLAHSSRVVVLGAFRSVHAIEQRSPDASTPRGLTLQGLVAALCKTAADAFRGPAWHQFPTPEDRLRLTLHLADAPQRFFKQSLLAKSSAAAAAAAAGDGGGRAPPSATGRGGNARRKQHRQASSSSGASSVISSAAVSVASSLRELFSVDVDYGAAACGVVDDDAAPAAASSASASSGGGGLRRVGSRAQAVMTGEAATALQRTASSLNTLSASIGSLSVRTQSLPAAAMQAGSLRRSGSGSGRAPALLPLPSSSARAPDEHSLLAAKGHRARATGLLSPHSASSTASSSFGPLAVSAAESVAATSRPVRSRDVMRAVDEATAIAAFEEAEGAEVGSFPPSSAAVAAARSAFRSASDSAASGLASPTSASFREAWSAEQTALDALIARIATSSFLGGGGGGGGGGAEASGSSTAASAAPVAAAAAASSSFTPLSSGQSQTGAHFDGRARGGSSGGESGGFSASGAEDDDFFLRSASTPPSPVTTQLKPTVQVPPSTAASSIRGGRAVALGDSSATSATVPGKEHARSNSSKVVLPFDAAIVANFVAVQTSKRRSALLSKGGAIPPSSSSSSSGSSIAAPRPPNESTASSTLHAAAVGTGSEAAADPASGALAPPTNVHLFPPTVSASTAAGVFFGSTKLPAPDRLSLLPADAADVRIRSESRQSSAAAAVAVQNALLSSAPNGAAVDDGMRFSGTAPTSSSLTSRSSSPSATVKRHSSSATLLPLAQATAAAIDNNSARFEVGRAVAPASSNLSSSLPSFYGRATPATGAAAADSAERVLLRNLPLRNASSSFRSAALAGAASAATLVSALSLSEDASGGASAAFNEPSAAAGVRGASASSMAATVTKATMALLRSRVMMGVPDFSRPMPPAGSGGNSSIADASAAASPRLASTRSLLGASEAPPLPPPVVRKFTKLTIVPPVLPTLPPSASSRGSSPPPDSGDDDDETEEEADDDEGADEPDGPDRDAAADRLAPHPPPWSVTASLLRASRCLADEALEAALLVLFRRYALLGGRGKRALDGSDAAASALEQPPRLAASQFQKLARDAAVFGRGGHGGGWLRSSDVDICFRRAAAQMLGLHGGAAPAGASSASAAGVVGPSSSVSSVKLWKHNGYERREVSRSMLVVGLDFGHFLHALALLGEKKYAVPTASATAGPSASSSLANGVVAGASEAAKLLRAALLEIDALAEMQREEAEAEGARAEADGKADGGGLFSKCLPASALQDGDALRLLLLRHVLPLAVGLGVIGGLEDVMEPAAAAAATVAMTTTASSREEEAVLPQREAGVASSSAAKLSSVNGGGFLLPPSPQSQSQPSTAPLTAQGTPMFGSRNTSLGEEVLSRLRSGSGTSWLLQHGVAAGNAVTIVDGESGRAASSISGSSGGLSSTSNAALLPPFGPIGVDGPANAPLPRSAPHSRRSSVHTTDWGTSFFESASDATGGGAAASSDAEGTGMGGRESLLHPPQLPTTTTTTSSQQSQTDSSAAFEVAPLAGPAAELTSSSLRLAATVAPLASSVPLVSAAAPSPISSSLSSALASIDANLASISVKGRSLGLTAALFASGLGGVVGSGGAAKPSVVASVVPNSETDGSASSSALSSEMISRNTDFRRAASSSTASAHGASPLRSLHQPEPFPHDHQRRSGHHPLNSHHGLEPIADPSFIAAVEASEEGAVGVSSFSAENAAGRGSEDDDGVERSRDEAAHIVQPQRSRFAPILPYMAHTASWSAPQLPIGAAESVRVMRISQNREVMSPRSVSPWRATPDTWRVATGPGSIPGLRGPIGGAGEGLRSHRPSGSRSVSPMAAVPALSAPPQGARAPPSVTDSSFPTSPALRRALASPASPRAAVRAVVLQEDFVAARPPAAAEASSSFSRSGWAGGVSSLQLPQPSDAILRVTVDLQRQQEQPHLRPLQPRPTSNVAPASPSVPMYSPPSDAEVEAALLARGQNEVLIASLPSEAEVDAALSAAPPATAIKSALHRPRQGSADSSAGGGRERHVFFPASVLSPSPPSRAFASLHGGSGSVPDSAARTGRADAAGRVDFAPDDALDSILRDDDDDEEEEAGQDAPSGERRGPGRRRGPGGLPVGVYQEGEQWDADSDGERSEEEGREGGVSREEGGDFVGIAAEGSEEGSATFGGAENDVEWAQANARPAPPSFASPIQQSQLKKLQQQFSPAQWATARKPRSGGPAVPPTTDRAQRAWLLRLTQDGPAAGGGQGGGGGGSALGGHNSRLRSGNNKEDEEEGSTRFPFRVPAAASLVGTEASADNDEGPSAGAVLDRSIGGSESASSVRSSSSWSFLSELHTVPAPSRPLPLPRTSVGAASGDNGDDDVYYEYARGDPFSSPGAIVGIPKRRSGASLPPPPPSLTTHDTSSFADVDEVPPPTPQIAAQLLHSRGPFIASAHSHSSPLHGGGNRSVLPNVSPQQQQPLFDDSDSKRDRADDSVGAPGIGGGMPATYQAAPASAKPSRTLPKGPRREDDARAPAAGGQFAASNSSSAAPGGGSKPVDPWRQRFKTGVAV